jgi:small subunit ribosomal protein S17
VNEANKGRKTVTGVVVSDKRDKTITVETRRLIQHGRYGKYMYRRTKLHAHDEKDEARSGDKVEIIETAPSSKQKRWTLVRIVEKGAVDMPLLEQEAADKAKKEKAKAKALEAKA